MCFNKPRGTIRNTSRKTDQRWIDTKVAWFKQNPGPTYECYLKISIYCPRKLTLETLVLEHVIPKSRGEKYKYDIANIRPSCKFCNFIKGSRTIPDMIKYYPHLGDLTFDSNL